jgi:hypothetical protein
LDGTAINVQGRSQPAGAADGAVLGLETEFIDDVIGLAILIVVDVDRVPHLVVEVEIIWSVARRLPRNKIHDERHAPISRRAQQIGLVITDEGIDVGVIGGWIERSQRRFAMARRKHRGAPGRDGEGQQSERQF